MKVVVNGTALDTQAATLAELLAEQSMAEAKVATAVNEDFVPATLRASHPLHEGDRIEIVAPRQGG